jgi:glutathione peroxidase
MKKLILALVFPVLTIQAPARAVPPLAGSLYDLKVNTLGGVAVPLSDYKGKVLLIVNTASKCGYTPQYEGLQTIYQRYRAKGFEILAFPSNDFGSQEPGNSSEIKKFCETKYKVSFPLFEKNVVSGSHKQPLYAWLVANEPKAKNGLSEVGWNFEKFLVSKSGKVLARFRSSVTPESPEVVSVIEGALK